MNDKNEIEEKLLTIIEKAWKEYPPKEMDEHTFKIRMPAKAWEVMSVGTKKLTGLDTHHFIWKTEVIERWTSWEVVTYETPRIY